jgi:hypothetical protein
MVSTGGYPMHSSLDSPDDDAWRTLPDYSPVVASELKHAYAALHWRGDAPQAEAHARPCLQYTMAEPQRLRVCYVLALAAAAAHQMHAALHWTDLAAESADQMEDHSALVALLYLRGALNFTVIALPEALQDITDGRAELRRLEERGAAPDTAAHFEFLTNSALLQFYLAHPTETARLLDEARNLVPYLDAADIGRDIARIPWLRALLCRWGGEPERAMRYGLEAARHYDDGNLSGSAAGSAVRIHLEVAEAMLDFAATLPLGTDRNMLLQMSRPHITSAVRTARAAGDDVGEALAELRAIRLDRFMTGNRDRVATIEALVGRASDLDDGMLRAQTLTALGDEWHARGEPGSAAGAYVLALAVATSAGVPAYGIWPRRALRQISGYP